MRTQIRKNNCYIWAIDLYHPFFASSLAEKLLILYCLRKVLCAIAQRTFYRYLIHSMLIATKNYSPSRRLYKGGLKGAGPFWSGGPATPESTECRFAARVSRIKSDLLRLRHLPEPVTALTCTSYHTNPPHPYYRPAPHSGWTGKHPHFA